MYYSAGLSLFSSSVYVPLEALLSICIVSCSGSLSLFFFFTALIVINECNMIFLYFFPGESIDTLIAKLCDEPPVLPNSSGWDCEYPGGPAFIEGHRAVAGTNCKLRCLRGFVLKPPHNLGFGRIGRITCLPNGNWSPPDSFLSSPCISSTCTKLRPPKDGFLFPDICTSDSVPLNTQCLVLCSPGYYPKNGRIRTCSKGFNWFPEDNPVCIRLPPTPRPYIHCPSDVTVDLKPGQSSAYVKIPQPQANMDWYRWDAYLEF